MIIILMGVAGSGKTTIGKLLANKLGWEFIEGDEFHTQENVKKMSRGISLDDEDRTIWLKRLSKRITEFIGKNESAIFACSALKQDYRDQLKQGQEQVRFIRLKGEYGLIKKRLQQRKGHFFEPDLLKSQFATLEEPDDVLLVDINDDPENAVNKICNFLDL